MFFKRKQHQENVDTKEVLIELSKKKLVKQMNNDIKNLDKLNNILSNGITLRIYRATGHKR